MCSPRAHLVLAAAAVLLLLAAQLPLAAAHGYLVEPAARNYVQNWRYCPHEVRQAAFRLRAAQAQAARTLVPAAALVPAGSCVPAGAGRQRRRSLTPPLLQPFRAASTAAGRDPAPATAS